MSIINDLISEIKHAKELNLPLTKNASNIVNFKNSRHNAIINSINSLLDRMASLNPDVTVIINNIREAESYDSMLDLAYELPLIEDKKSRIIVPSIVSDEIRADWQEANNCFDNELFRSCVILCGRILEIALHAKYYMLTNVDLLEKAPGIGLGNLIAKLSDRGAFIDPGLSNQIHLINQIRIHSVHKKSIPFLPSKIQAKAIMLYTKDAVERLFDK